VWKRILVASAIAAVAAILVFALWLRHPQLLAHDFTWHWRAARALLDGQNPYDVIRPTGPYPFSAGYYYPLPAALVALPVATLSAGVAKTISVGVWTFLFAFAVTRDGWYRLPLFLSAGFFWSVVSGQTVPLLAVGCLIPAFQIFEFTKPNVGLAVFAYRPSKWTIIGAVVGSIIMLAVLPTWIADWRGAIQRDPGEHITALGAPGGFLTLLALLRWRRPEARMLLVLAIVPQTLAFYDARPLLLIARTFRQALVLSVCTQAANIFGMKAMTAGLPPIEVFHVIAPYEVAGCFIPPLVLILSRPNEGYLPQFLESAASRLPGWMRGAPERQLVPTLPNAADEAVT
jgi:hypothetical protein